MVKMFIHLISIASGDGIVELKQILKWHSLEIMNNSENSS